MANFIDKLFAPLLSMLHQSIESFIRLETAEDEFTLAAEDGSLVSYIRVDGCRQLIGPAEYLAIVEQATVKLGARFDRMGYGLQFYFSRDPQRARSELENLMRPNRSAAKAIGLDLDDLFEERARTLARWLAWEDMYMVLWTRPSALNKTDLVHEKKMSAQKKWVVAVDAQYPMAAVGGLKARHATFVSSVKSSLDDMGVQSQLLEVHAALKAVRSSIYPTISSDRWRPCLPGDPMPPRLLSKKNDLSDLLWPPLRQQLCVMDGEIVSTTAVQLGDLIWSAVDLTLAPMEPQAFPALLSRLAEAGIPFRISFLIESGGVEGAAMRKAVAAVLGFTSEVNKQIKRSLDGLQELARNSSVVKLRVSFATWAPQGELKLLESRTASLTQSVESWGYCQVSHLSGDPLEGVMSSALGIACASTAPAAVAPLREVVKLLPWQRASSPFVTGAILLRTADGRVWPYQTGSSLTTTWFDLIFAQPGAGKSVLMNAMNLGTILTAGMSQLPFIAMVDIGPSSSGLISLIRESLPPDRRHEAVHFRLRMQPEYAVNPFDTQLGCRYPLPDERSYLTELLVLLCTPAGQDTAYDGIPQLAGLVIDEMFRWRDDTTSASEPRLYMKNIDREVDESLKRRNINLPAECYWWDVVDLLFDAGLIHEAQLAQRNAVPVLADCVVAARRPQIRALLEETSVGASSESVIHAFERMVTSAIREFPILSSVTKFDIGTARVCAVDLGEVAPQGDANADRQTAIMYMLARHTMIRQWWLGPDTLKMMNRRYRPYHESRLKDMRETPKRICYDEFHRTSRTRSVRAQIVRDVREGRKWGVQIVLASQLLEDFDDNMVDLATGVWILGAAVSDRAVIQTAERFGLSETAKWVMRHRLTGPRASGAPALLVLGTNEGRYEQFLINTLGPVELWALSTSSEDMEIRNRLYVRLGSGRARTVLAQAFPGGSARREIQRRVTLRSESGDVESGALSVVMDGIIEEMVTLSGQMLMKAAAE